MESWNSTLKSELGERFESPADAKAKLFDYIEVFYNRIRMHSSIGYSSPAEFERAGRTPKTRLNSIGFSTGCQSPPGPPSIHNHPTGDEDQQRADAARVARAARAEVIEILSGAVFTLLLAGRLRPLEAPTEIAPANGARS